MNVIRGLEQLPHDWPECAVAVGMFDGVHWGHHAVIVKLVEEGASAAAEPVVLTFDRHPAETLAPNRAPDYITTLDQRIELIRAAGAGRIVVAEFDPKLASLSPDEFITSILRDALRAKSVVVGSDFRFGKQRSGDVRFLSAALKRLGIGLSVVPAVIVAGGPVSSTRVRAMIERGDVEGASKLLGRRFALRGTVVSGRGGGRSLGFPTANIQVEPKQLTPSVGVYAVESMVDMTNYSGVCNIGHRPTFGGGPRVIEVHLSGFRGSVYGQIIDVVFCRRLRDEMTFESPERLAEQIKADLKRATGQRD